MKKIEICFSPELIHLHDLGQKNIVVVDIFRATSTMITALANGVKSITPVADLETCREMSKDGYVIAGERNGFLAEGFELGNSPLVYLNGVYAEKKIAMSTTNGTMAIEKSKLGSNEILVGAFLNLEATSNYLALQEHDILIHCAGWKGKFNLEDSLYAGALVSLLAEKFDWECDGAIAMKRLYEQNAHQLKAFLNQASHAKRLQNQNIEADIDFCLEINQYEIVGKLVGQEILAFEK